MIFLDGFRKMDMKTYDKIQLLQYIKRSVI